MLLERLNTSGGKVKGLLVCPLGLVLSRSPLLLLVLLVLLVLLFSKAVSITSIPPAGSFMLVLGMLVLVVGCDLVAFLLREEGLTGPPGAACGCVHGCGHGDRYV